MIGIIDHSKKIASKVIGVFKEDIPVRLGFSKLFPKEMSSTLHVDVEVERDNDLIAVDVKRNTEGNDNVFTQTSEHKYKPPFYKENYNFAEDEVYMTTAALGATEVKGANEAIAKNALKNVRKNKKKIVRAERKMQADVLQNGVVIVKNGDSIDFRRKAESMPDLGAVTGGKYWSDNTADVIANIKTGGRFLRDVGNSTSSTLNLIMSGDAMTALLNNESPEFLKIIEKRRINRADIVMSNFDEETGMAFHGQFSAGDFNVNLFTYNEKYSEIVNGVKVTKTYLKRENAILIPDDFQGKMAYGALPYMRKASAGGQSTMIPAAKKADYMLRAWSDEKTTSSTLSLSSAPLPVPFTVDKVYTMKVLATI